MNKPVVGFYSGVRLDNKLIKSYPFEIAYEIDSTLARLITLIRWNEITSWPTFMRQSSFEDVFGFAVNQLKIFYSKFIFSNIFSFIENIWKSHWRDHQMINDGKIHLLYQIKAKIKEEINLLMPVLMLRFAGKDYLRVLQSKCKCV